MVYDEGERTAQEQVERLMASGVPTTQLSVFDILDGYTPSDRIKNKVVFTRELYLELVDKLKELSEDDRVLFLKTLKDSDVIDNQSIKKEDSFMLALFRNFESEECAIDLLLLKLMNNEPISKEEFVKMHDVLFRGTSSHKKMGLRENDLKFVGSRTPNPQTKFVFGDRAISYFPLRHTEIDTAIDRFLSFINSGVKPNNEYDDFLLPIACHGLLAALQLFKDGNTRYARLFQSALLYKLTNNSMSLKLPLPIVYASRQYAAFRDDYRKTIEDIVVENDAEAWENWFSFCLNKIQDGIYNNINCVERIKNLPRYNIHK